MTGDYYDAAGRFICPSCRERLESRTGDARRLLTAAGLGAAAAILGGLLWFAVRRLTGYEIGLIAIAVGFIVGYAVRLGAKGRGGARYQALAVFLTYSGVALNYAPDVWQSLSRGTSENALAAHASGKSAPAAPSAADAGAAAPPEDNGAARAVARFLVLSVAVIGVSYAAPFLVGVENLLGLLIIGFALYEAWKLNRRVSIQGPYRTAPAVPAEAGVG